MSKRNAEPDPRAAPANPLAWALEYLPDYFTNKPADFHDELLRDLANPKNRLIARVAPRGHAKSTCGALAYPLWCICEQHRRNIVIITHESLLATQFVRDIRYELETNERIIDQYGDLCREEPTENKRRVRRKWSEVMFTTTTGITVQAKGSGAGFRGARVGPHRPDLIICDDIEKDEHVQSPEGRRKLEHWLRRVVMPALAPDGQLVVLGSLIHYDSLLANLCDKQRFPRWNYEVYRALEGEQAKDGEYYLKSLWPDRWPVELLEEERERVGTLAFEQEYMANPVDDSIRTFQPEWLQRYEPDELKGKKLFTLMTVDPATGVTGGDFFALWVGSVDQDTGIIYTRALELERIGIVDQVRRIIAAFEQWKPIRIGIETTAYQVALQQILDEHSRRQRLYMPIVGFNTTTNKVARIQGSSPFYENGTFRLPPALAPEVESQFLHHPKGRHDDAPDVCAMGIELARTLSAARTIDGTTAVRNPFSRKGGW